MKDRRPTAQENLRRALAETISERMTDAEATELFELRRGWNATKRHRQPIAIMPAKYELPGLWELKD